MQFFNFDFFLNHLLSAVFELEYCLLYHSSVSWNTLSLGLDWASLVLTMTMDGSVEDCSWSCGGHTNVPDTDLFILVGL